MTNQYHRFRRAFAAVVVTALAVTIASCVDSDEPTIIEPAGGTLFDRYVSLGNSLTAGFQSGGIVDSVQQEAYPVLLAAKADAPFGVPALAPPGCPPLLVGPLTTQRTSTESCGLRIFDAPDLVQNLAVPGANTGHLSNTVGTGNTLNTLILGGRTQIGAMQDADPTLISVWIGNNDALGAALSGDTLALTPTATFQSEYDEIVDAMTATDAEDAVLIGVVDPMTAAPALQPGAYFWALAQDPPPGLPTINVSNNCAPFDGTGQPNPTSQNLVSFIGVGNAIAAGEDPLTIDCVNGVEIGGAYSPDYLLNAAEMAVVATRIATFNGYIQQQASDNGWIYVDPATSVIPPVFSDPDKLRKCQDLATATDAGTFAAAVQSSCPVDLDPTTPETFYGSYMSVDGIHPTLPFQQLVADTLAARLNTVHGISLPMD